MKISDKLYSILSYCGKIVLPALSVFVLAIEEALGFNIYADEISKILMASDVLLNTLLGITTVEYYKEKAEQTEGTDL